MMPSNKITILSIVSGEELLQQLFGFLADRYRMYLAEDGYQGLAKAFRHLPDIILVTEQLPHNNSLEVCKSLKKSELTSHIPIILLTFANEPNTNPHTMDVDAVLTVPIREKDLFIQLQSAIRQRILLLKRYPLFYQKDNPYTREDAFLSRYIASLF